MIIEFVDLADMAEPGEPNKLIFLHIDIPNDSSVHVQGVYRALRDEFPKFKVIQIPNGKPCDNNPLPKFAVFNCANKSLREAVELICQRHRPGAMIPMTPDQMKALTTAVDEGDLKYFP